MDTLSYKTVSANKATVTKEWVLVDAEGQTLGRLSSKVAKILRGNTNNHITEPSQTGVTMLSGFSGASILKDFFLDNITLSSSSIDKLKVNILDKPRYKAIYDTYNIINT